MEIWFVHGVESQSIDARLFFVTRQSLLGAHFLADLVILNLFAPSVFIQCDAVIVQLLAQALHIFHHVMKLRITFDALSRATLEFFDKEGMAVRPLRVVRHGHFIVRQTVFQRAFAELR